MLSLNEKRCLGDYLNLIAPLMISFVSYALISSADNIMIAKLGVDHIVPAAFLVNRICSVPILFCIGFSGIVAPIAASGSASKSYEEASQALYYIILLLTGFSLLFTLCFAMPTFLDRLGQPPVVVELARGYFRLIVASIFPTAICQPIKRYMGGLGWVRVNMFLALLGGGVNILLNYLLMFGAFGFPAMGVLGAGWATLITRWLVLLIYLGYAGYLQQIGLIIIKKTQANLLSLGKVIQLGLPGGLDLGSKMAYLNLMTHLMMGWLGPIHQKAGSILFFTMNTVALIPAGVFVSSAILMGRALRENPEKKRLICKVGYCLMGGMIVVSSLLFLLVWSSVCELMEASKADIAIATPLIPFILLIQGFDCFSYLGIYLLRGLRDTVKPFMINLISWTLIGFPASYFLGFYFQWGMAGILQGLILAFLTTTLLLGFRLHRQISYSPASDDASKQ